jgi:serine kinase of HPr protein (carbohydrate metabolism regulator)
VSEDQRTVHATAVVIGEEGILIRGAAGSGKSTLARELIRWAADRGRHGALVSDDRVALERCHGRLVARAVPAIAGLLEIRGLGIVRVPGQDAALVRLVVDLNEEAPRLPEDPSRIATLNGVELPRVVVKQALALGVVVWRIGDGVTVS